MTCFLLIPIYAIYSTHWLNIGTLNNLVVIYVWILTSFSMIKIFDFWIRSTTFHVSTETNCSRTIGKDGAKSCKNGGCGRTSQIKMTALQCKNCVVVVRKDSIMPLFVNVEPMQVLNGERSTLTLSLQVRLTPSQFHYMAFRWLPCWFYYWSWTIVYPRQVLFIAGMMH